MKDRLPPSPLEKHSASGSYIMRDSSLHGKIIRSLSASALLIVLAPQGTLAQAARVSTPKRQLPTARKPASAVSLASKPTATYWVYVGAESADLLHRIKFGPEGATVERTIATGELAAENEGPHGLQISPDGKYLYMTTGHGNPDGKLWKYETGADTIVAPPIFLGNFPASLDISPDGLYAFSANFNLHGSMVPSSISVVYTPTLTEVAQTTTCTMPHGSRFDASGMKQYSTCMMDDQLVEIDTRSFQVARRFGLAKGKEGAIEVGAVAHAAHHMTAGAPMKMDADAGHGVSMSATCSPTWAQPSAKAGRVYVACNKSNEIIEIDADSWKVTRRFATGTGPYNLAVTADGKLLVATLKKGGALEVIDLASGKSVMQEVTSTTLAHGVVVSPDSRYAFVSAEGVGAKPGKVDVFDLVARKRVASVDVGQQASGIAFWKMEGK